VLPVIPVRIDGVALEDVRAFLKSDPPIDGASVEISDILERGGAVGERQDVPVLNADALKKVEPTSVLVCEWKKAARVLPSYFLNPGLESVNQCRGFNSFFNDLDFELTFLETGRCPICKTPLDTEGEGEFADTYDSYSDLLRQLRDFAAEIPIHF
jgi:hypothetical protein